MDPVTRMEAELKRRKLESGDAKGYLRVVRLSLDLARFGGECTAFGILPVDEALGPALAEGLAK